MTAGLSGRRTSTTTSALTTTTCTSTTSSSSSASSSTQTSSALCSRLGFTPETDASGKKWFTRVDEDGATLKLVRLDNDSKDNFRNRGVRILVNKFMEAGNFNANYKRVGYSANIYTTSQVLVSEMYEDGSKKVFFKIDTQGVVSKTDPTGLPKAGEPEIRNDLLKLVVTSIVDAFKKGENPDVVISRLLKIQDWDNDKALITSFVGEAMSPHQTQLTTDLPANIPAAIIQLILSFIIIDQTQPFPVQLAQALNILVVDATD